MEKGHLSDEEEMKMASEEISEAPSESATATQPESDEPVPK